MCPYAHHSNVYESQDMHATDMPSNKTPDKADVADTHSGMALFLVVFYSVSHRKECNLAVSGDTDGPVDITLS